MDLVKDKKEFINNKNIDVTLFLPKQLKYCNFIKNHLIENVQYKFPRVTMSNEHAWIHYDYVNINPFA